MKSFVMLVFLLTLGACASHQQNGQTVEAAPVVVPVKKEAAYNGNCPMGLCLKKMVKGDDKYELEYKGNRYIFSSSEARDKFVSNIEANIKKADAHWAVNGEKIK